MRKFNYKDIYDWKVVDNRGKVMPYQTKDKKGKAIFVRWFPLR